MDKILEALKKVLPGDQVNEVTTAVTAMLEESKKELEAEYQKNLDEAYTQMTKELAEAEETAEQGYRDAYAIIQDQQNRQDAMREEFERVLEEQYEEAYKMILEERGKNSDLESQMYEEYDSKLQDMKSYIVDKVDEFLQTKGKEIYEQAYRDATNDPVVAEHKVVLDKIINIASNYLSEEEMQFATSQKLQESQAELTHLRSQVKVMEGRNIRLSTDNTKLQQKLNEAATVLKESRMLTEQKERVGKAANVTGKGQIHLTENEKVIPEFGETEVAKKTDNNNTLSESNEMGIDVASAQRLAGIK
jgi:hypothetical protein